MGVNARTWRKLSIASLGAIALAGLLFSASPASAGGTWAQATEVPAPANAQADPGASFSAVSCSSVGNCTASGTFVDSSGSTQATVATESSATWARATAITAPSNSGNSFPGASLPGISCSSVGNCAATGRYVDGTGDWQAMAVTETSGTWAQATEVAAPANAQADPQAGLNGVSCLSVGNCTASGGYVDSSGNKQAMVVTETSGTWAQAIEVTAPVNAQANPIAGLRGISCWSVGNCTGTGSYIDSSGNNQAMAATETSGTWAQAIEVTAPANAQANPSASLGAVSCSSADNCTSAGNYIDSSPHPQAMAATETSGSWAQAIEVTAPADAGSGLPGAGLGGISCSSVGNCTAAGGYVDSSGNKQAMVVTETSGTWTQATEVTAPANAATGILPGASLSAVSCSSIGSCTAVGGYGDNSGKSQAMAASESAPPVTPVATKGYWLVASDGGIFTYGDAAFYGSTGATHPQQAHRGDGGHARRQGLLAGGLRRWHLRLRRRRLLRLDRRPRPSTSPSWAWRRRPTARATGWWPPTAASSPTATPPSTARPAATTLNKPIVGMAATPDGKGYWLVASDGGIFAYGDAAFYGSTGGHDPQPADRGDGGHARRPGLLAGGLRRWHLRLRRRPLLRLHR